MINHISVNSIQENINSFFMVMMKKEVTSTNDVLGEMSWSGAAEGTVLIAEKQTSGKGRKGRSFYSPGEKGIYMSILLRPRFSPETCVKLTPLAAVAVAEAIENITKINADIKWVNDVLIGGKKVCGILTESSYSATKNHFDHVIVGIGINLCAPEKEYPEEIKNIATALSDHTDVEIDINKLIPEVLNRFLKYYLALPEITFFEEYKNRMSFLGQKVKVIHANHSEECIAEGITDGFHLLVRDENGIINELNSGEISIIL